MENTKKEEIEIEDTWLPEEIGSLTKKEIKVLKKEGKNKALTETQVKEILKIKNFGEEE